MESQAIAELIRKIHELESAHISLREDISKLLISGTLASGTSDLASVHATACGRLDGDSRYSTSWKRISPSSSGHSSSPFKVNSRVDVSSTSRNSHDSRGCAGLPLSSQVGQLNAKVYLNILQSMGQAIHIMNTEDRLIYWNRPAEKLYGYSAAEALGKSVFELLVDFEHYNLGSVIVNRVKVGECWTGLFPVRSKTGRRFSIIVTDTPLYDEDGTVIGVICVASDSKPFEDMRFTLPEAWCSSEANINLRGSRNSVSTKLGLDPEQPLQDVIASKFTDLATKVSNKVWSKMRTGREILEREVGSSDSHRSSNYCSSNANPFCNEDDLRSNIANLRGNAASSFFGTISKTGELASKLIKDLGEESEGRPSFHKITSKAEAWINKKSIRWPWKGNLQEHPAAKFNNDILCHPAISEVKANESSRVVVAKEPGTSLSWVHVSNTSNLGRCISTNTTSSFAKQLDLETDCLDCEIFWEDLTFKQQIGQGSCGTVYHGLWCGSDIAIKVFPKVEYSEDAILSFRKEVSLMKGLRHPNILLFMGAVMSAQNLCIITEFLPRGSLFQLLQRSVHKLDWRRRVHMALDVARGVNYLHRCNPPIVHRDLKSSNLLVDKNWNVKVADFGLSRIKHETFLTTKSGKGTPQWMAPEVLRNELSDEKSDVYSFGVILWELATEKIPWEDLNSMQIIGAVGFMNRRLDIPSDLDPRWAAIIESCWQSEPRDRPTFEKLLKTLKLLAREYAIEFQAPRYGPDQ